MVKINPYKLLKAELQIYLSGYCKHRVPYAQHPMCFIREIQEGGKKRITGVLDIEFDNFKADFGTILTYAIKVLNQKKVYTGRIYKKDLDNYDFDKRIVKCLIRDINKFDELITYYGTKCDIPYIRTRALYHNLDFPFYGFIKHIDLYYWVKFRLKLHRNSLDSACRFLGIEEKNHVDMEIWRKAKLGDKKSLDYVLEHNIRDTIATEKVYHALKNYTRKTQRSL